MSNAIRWRLVAVGMLAVGSLILLMANMVGEKIDRNKALREVHARPLLAQVNAVVDTLLGQYQVDPRWVKSWNVFTRNKKFIREERRIYVPPGFISLDFNHDLSSALAPFGVQVIATERTRESSVSMHILHGGMIIESVSFVVKRDLE